MSLSDDIQKDIEEYEPMVDGWVLSYETTTINEDGDLGGQWGLALRGGTSQALGLMAITTSRLTAQFNGRTDLD